MSIPRTGTIVSQPQMRKYRTKKNLNNWRLGIQEAQSQMMKIETSEMRIQQDRGKTSRDIIQPK